MNIIPYGKQEITQEDINEVVAVLKSDFLTQGPKIEEFERAFASYIGCKYAVAVANGTAALHLCTLALGVNEKSKVITTPITFAASANCVRYCGGEVEFSDIDPATFLIDLKRIEELLDNAPKDTYHGIIPVDFAGAPVDLEKLQAIAKKHNLWIIEDACHAPGGYFEDSKGRKINCGSCEYSDLAIFSFHPVKHIATGEGGMITTNRKDLYEKLLLLRTHGITKNPELMHENHGGWYYEMQELGYNYRLSDMQAALGVSQLKRAEVNLQKRRKLAERYNQGFKNSKITIPVADKGHAYHLYVIQTDKRKELYDFLKTRNIYCQVHYIPVHTLPYYKSIGWNKGDFPVAETYYEKCLSLPMYQGLSFEEQDRIIELVLDFI
ncbi:MAG: UDP-4-amino-4,6-dideoxy-N-acetyl-beta-L-altrosamine transaminase [Cytophagaceae bacterium]